MPYIKKRRREVIDKFGIDEVSCAGELNYFITSNILRWLGKVESYAVYNEVIGVLEAVKLELYRRVISKYEDKKCKENGEVYNE